MPSDLKLSVHSVTPDVTLTLSDPYIGSAYSPQVDVTEIEGGHEVTITHKAPSGIITDTFDVLDGVDGTDGVDGVSPTVEIESTTDAHTITITDADGAHSYTVDTYADEEAARATAESSRVAAESSRVTAEQARATAESSRAAAESARVTAEASRATAEQSRAAAESSRAEAEQARATAETTRATAESARATTEQGRATAEQSRATAETARASAESVRVTAEQGRASAENARASAESARVTAESARASAETSRATAETARASAETARASEWATIKSEAENATSAAESATQAATDAAAEASLVNATASKSGGTTTITVTDRTGTPHEVQVLDGDPAEAGGIGTEQLADSAVTSAKLKDGAVRPSGTSFSSELSGTTVTTLTEIGTGCTTYEGYTASSDGTFAANANFNSYLLVCPEDGYAITTNAYRLFVVGSAPNVDAGTVQVVSVLINNNTTSAITATVPNKGDLVLVVENKGYSFLLSTKSAMPISIPRLALTDFQESFSRYSARHDSTAFGNPLLDIHSVTGLLNVNTGGITSEQTSYTTYYFRVPVPTLTVTCTNGFRALLAYKNPTDGLTVNNIQTLYTYASGRVDTFTAAYGQWVCISVANSTGAIDLKTDLIKTFTLPSLELDYLQVDSFYRYEQVGALKYLYVYYRSGANLVRWELHNVPSAGINSDTWQIGHVLGYNIVDGAPANEVELVGGGEFELAFKEHGAADYCGGNNHGDETTDTFVLHIDGKQVADLTTLGGAYHKFNRIDAIEIATVNRCDTPSEDILKHQKVWTFEGGTVRVKQTVKFLETLVIDGALVCMFAANRASFPYGIRQGSTAIEDMSAQGYTQLSTSNNDMFYLMYGSNATAKISSNSHNTDGISRLWINDTSTTNKLYYSYYGDSNSTYPKTIPADTVWQIESAYDVAYS